jgi:hypothetical protein
MPTAVEGTCLTNMLLCTAHSQFLTFCSVSPAVCARELVRHSTKCSFSMKVLTTWASTGQTQQGGCSQRCKQGMMAAGEQQSCLQDNKPTSTFVGQ